MKINIIVPTLNELDNIKKIFDTLCTILNKTKYSNSYKICFVDDDSQDGSKNLLEKLKSENPTTFDYTIRKSQKGLSSAITHGFDIFKADYYMVTDADIQYDLNVIPNMLDQIIDSNKDIVLANRLTEQKNDNWKKSFKYLVSRGGFKITQFLIRKKLPEDILTGFFTINNNFYLNVREKLTLIGFKIVLDIFLSRKKNINFGEVSCKFKNREAGESKMDFSVLCDFIFMISQILIPLNKKIVRYIIYMLLNIPGIIFFLCSYNVFRIFNLEFHTSIFISLILKLIFNINLFRLIEWSYNRKNYFKFIYDLNYRYILGLIITFCLINILGINSLSINIFSLIILVNTSINYLFIGKKWKIV